MSVLSFVLALVIIICVAGTVVLVVAVGHQGPRPRRSRTARRLARIAQFVYGD